MTPRTRRVLIGSAAGALALVLLVPLALIGAVDHGLADGVVMKGLSAKMQRPVRFSRLHANLLSGDPTLVFDDVVVGSPPQITPDDLLHARRLTAHLQLRDALAGRFAPTALAIASADLRLVRLGSGRNNYTLGKGGTGGLLEGVKTLSITDGHMWMADPERQVFIAGPFSHDGRPAVALPLVLDARGAIQHGGVELLLKGGPLNGRKPDAPWPIDATMIDGDTRMRLAGSLQKPFDFRGFDLDAKAHGPNLAAVGYLVGSDTPNSRSFDLSAQIRRANHVVYITRISGKLGESDLAGSINVAHPGDRKLITATLRAGALHAEDVAAALAPAPSHAIARIIPAHGPAVAVKGLATHEGLPLKGLRKLDGNLDLNARRVLGYAAPLADLDLKARLKAGRLAVTPVSFGLSLGRVSGAMTLDASRDQLSWTLAGRLAGARLGSLKPAIAKTADGDLDAWADLKGGGASVRAATAAASGRAAFRISRGRIQRGPAAILGGDLFQAAGLALGDKAATAPLTCAVGEFSAKGGVLSAEKLVIVTGAGATQGTGAVDLGRGTVDLVLKGTPTKRRLLHIDAPVTVTGALTHPKVGLDKGKALRQAGVAGALAVVATPLAAVIPFLGRTGAAPDCAALLAEPGRFVEGPRR